MTTTTHPPKQLVREWLERRTHAQVIPPTAEEVRQQLGWYLIPENRRPDWREE
jgi:hypothetical protein